jgi:hypothetical protein
LKAARFAADISVEGVVVAVVHVVGVADLGSILWNNFDLNLGTKLKMAKFEYVIMIF